MNDLQTNQSPAAESLPETVRAHFNGELDGRSIVAWAEFDLDSELRFARQAAVLTEEMLVIAAPTNSLLSIAVSSIKETRIADGLGVDRLIVIGDEEHVLAEMRYTRAHRREMVNLNQLIQARLSSSEPETTRPAATNRRAELKIHCPKCGRTIPAYAEGVCPFCLQRRAILWRLLDVAKPYRGKINVALAATLLVAVLSALPPVYQKYIIDRGIGTATQPGSLNQLWLWTGMFMITAILIEVLFGLRLRLLSTVGTSTARDLRHKVYAHLHDLSLRFFAKRRTGSLITRVTTDTDRLWEFIVFGSVDVIRHVIAIAVMAGIMFWMNPALAAVALIPIPILAVMTWLRSKTLHRMFGRLWTYWSRLGATVGDSLPGVRVVKAFANEGREVARFDVRSNEYTDREQEVNNVWSTFVPVVSGTMRTGAVIVWLFGGWLVLRNPNDPRFSVGTLIAFIGFLQNFYGPVMELANSNRMVTRAASSAQRVFEVLDTPPDVFSPPDAVKKDRLNGDIEFRNVTFRYDAGSAALKELSLTINAGEMLGLCGRSGAGKSTLVNLLCRFYDVTDGQILIDGVDIRDYDVKWLRRQIGMVLQEPYLFHGTVAENIRYGNPNAADGEVIRAARAANAHDFIVAFHDGYDTMVGERGQSLSGGERQRISIARAILHNPRILILDEATSSVDSETEKQIQQALERLVEGRTTIAIAHRLSTLHAADRIAVLEKGKLIEEGPHDELVSKEGGVYAKLHEMQVELAVPEDMRS